MAKEKQLLEHWRELTPEKQQKVLEFVESLKSESEATSINTEYIPQTPLAQKLWEIRQRAMTSGRSETIASGIKLLTAAEIEQELAEHRGGYRES
ncbi:hypothetical protein [Anabaena sp. CCY 9402-a]|uniref:hypothetical protein n=1 Tax=Anabaena sp. CCY 9402-a TaxID=3103867 RepID=UPI0039C71634